jgi:hypothetical protein
VLLNAALGIGLLISQTNVLLAEGKPEDNNYNGVSTNLEKGEVIDVNVYSELFATTLLHENEKNLNSNIVKQDIQYHENYLTVQSTAFEEVTEFADAYITNLSYVAYDPIGGTFIGSLYNAQFIVYVNNAYSSGLTFRKPVYYSQQINSFDAGLGNPALLTSNSHFVGVWGDVGNPMNYYRIDPSSLSTYGTGIGTRSTGISSYFVVSLSNSCFFDISVLWNVKGGSQIQLNNTFTLW